MPPDSWRELLRLRRGRPLSGTSPWQFLARSWLLLIRSCQVVARPGRSRRIQGQIGAGAGLGGQLTLALACLRLRLFGSPVASGGAGIARGAGSAGCLSCFAVGIAGSRAGLQGAAPA